MQVGRKQLINPKLSSLVEESRQFYRARKTAALSKKQPDLTTSKGLQEARSARKPSSPLLNRKVLESTADSNGRKVPIRVISPKHGKSQAVFLNIPGGGFYFDEAERNDLHNSLIADELGVTVVSVKYRLAPENPWPAAPDDCLKVALWLIKQADQLFGTSRLIIGGSSAGATLAMVTLLRLRDKKLIDQFTGTVLQFGAYDLSGKTPGGRLYKDEYFIEAYAGKIADKTQPEVSPLFGDLRGLPPALLIVGTADILMEDNFAMAARLSASGCDVDLRVYPEAPHGFTSHTTKMGEAAMQDILNWLKRCLDS